MKYGEQLEHQSVPQWSIHNLDYNFLKHEIKAHTTRNQAVAIAIPGHQDLVLRKFQDGLLLELCRQHDRVDLFIISKADEVSRCLGHLERRFNRWIGKRAEPRSISESRKHWRFAKYERELLRCGNDIRNISRFANAQVIGFQKIIKKYQKWTGSTTLGSLFRENVLSSPKSFTCRDFSGLRGRYEEILNSLHNASLQFSEASFSSTDSNSVLSRPGSSRSPGCFGPLPPPAQQEQQQQNQQDQQPHAGCWNEYDDGSEACGQEDHYVIHMDPDEPAFPHLGYIRGILSAPFEKAKSWLLPHRGHTACYAFPSIGDQSISQCRKNILHWATIGCFFVSFAMLAISSVLITTGRRELRVEVDTAAAVGVVISLFSACSGLGAAMYYKDPWSIFHCVTIGSAFIVACFLNGMLLVLVVGNAP